MAWKHFNYECDVCRQPFTSLVDDRDEEGTRDPCPHCNCNCKSATRTVNSASVATLRIPMYPGNKAQKAGTGAEARRPAEKKGRQISMVGTSKGRP